jgi:hypothetical protein
VRLLVEGTESVLTTCQRHADWLRGYVQEDAAVRLVESFSEDFSPRPAGPDPG